jgi:hypothetical protein
MDVKRREYSLNITFNKRCFSRVIIDSHYEKKHPEINDELVLAIVKLLDDKEIDAVDESDGFKYFAHELYYKNKPYRIVLTYCDEDFLGVINTFRVREITL